MSGMAMYGETSVCGKCYELVPVCVCFSFANMKNTFFKQNLLLIIIADHGKSMYVTYISGLLVSHLQLLLSILQGLRVFIELILCPLQLLLHLQELVFMLMEWEVKQLIHGIHQRLTMLTSTLSRKLSLNDHEQLLG